MCIKSTKKFADLIFGGKIILRDFFWRRDYVYVELSVCFQS